jgi:SAM-dependent methyltransferase
MVGRVEASVFGAATRRYFELHRFLPPAAGSSHRLLDLGCGEGVTLEGLARPGWSVFGVDVSPTAVEAARRRMPGGTFIAGDWTEAARLGRFDLVRLDNVLEHMLDPGAVLRTARGLVDDGGWLAVYVPHGESLSLRWLGSRSLNHWPPFHLHLFTETSLRRALGDAGFGAVEIVRVDPPTWWDLSMRHLLDRRWRERPPSPRAIPFLRAAALPLRALSAALAAGEELAAFARAT